jgi:digeranylgeranylglycerophospholipid reductase
MRNEYDAVVIGAGPAGSMAAYEIGKAGNSVLLVEKHKRPGLPLCCAEAVSRQAFDKILPPRSEWISATINRVRVESPSGKAAEFHYPEAGYILDRKIFDLALAERVSEVNGHLECEAIALELRGENGRFENIKVIKPEGQTASIKAKIFIAADGVESRIARLAGINNLIDINEVVAHFQYRLENIRVAPDLIEFYVGQEVAPGSYLWVFPKSSDSANVGIGVSLEKHTGNQAGILLRQFIDRKFPEARIVEKTCGLVPKYQGENMFRRGNLLVIGDAARAVDSLSGAGIVNGMLSGKYAALAANEYIAGRIGSEKELDNLYPGRFLAEKGEELQLYAKLWNVYKRMDDKDFDDVIQGLGKLPEQDIKGVGAAKILAGLVSTRPRLLRHLRHLI